MIVWIRTSDVAPRWHAEHFAAGVALCGCVLPDDAPIVAEPPQEDRCAACVRALDALEDLEAAAGATLAAIGAEFVAAMAEDAPTPVTDAINYDDDAYDVPHVPFRGRVCRRCHDPIGPDEPSPCVDCRAELSMADAITDDERERFARAVGLEEDVRR